MAGEPVDLTEKLGPLAYWQWALAAIAGYFVYSHYLHPSTTAAAPAVDPNAAGTSDPNADPNSYLGESDILGSSGTSSNGYYGDTSSLSGLASPTNDSWIHNAINGLLGSQYDSADVEQALVDFRDGNPLTAAEQAIVSTAINRFGAPPDALSIIKAPIATTTPSPILGTTPNPLPHIDPTTGIAVAGDQSGYGPGMMHPGVVTAPAVAPTTPVPRPSTSLSRGTGTEGSASHG